MKRILALILAAMMIAAVMCACGEKKDSQDSSNDNGGSGSSDGGNKSSVTTTVESNHENTMAEKFAKSVTTDKEGNKVYEFDDESYKEYTRNYNNQVSAAITSTVTKNHDAKFGQYCYINDEKKAVIVGVNPGKYDEKAAAKEAESLAQMSFAYFQGLETPVDKMSVQYVNANDQNEIYGKFEFDVK